MRYITEGELRDAWRREHFSVFNLGTDSKLTPGARQFLFDFHIDVIEAGASSGCACGVTGVTNESDSRITAEHLCVAFHDDVRVLAAQARLLARRSLDLDAALSHALESSAQSWESLDGWDVSIERAAERCDDVVFATLVIPSLDGATNLIYYEVALFAADLERIAHVWMNARRGMSERGRAFCARWIEEAVCLFGEVCSAVECKGMGDKK